jgi:hypothetical protein
MITKIDLEQAKAFLCWDAFTDLSIQLIERNDPVSYYIPPSDQSTILLFYPAGTRDFSKSLFLLFHEIGHRIQFDQYQRAGLTDQFWECVNTPTGQEKMNFELESWQAGRHLLEQFTHQMHIEPSLINQYDTFAQESLKSYQ